MTKSFGTETQRVLSSMIYDDEVEVLTTFDMNRIATLTFGDEVCGEIFDVLEYSLRHPIEFTVLTLHKCIVLLRHLAIYASQKAANATWILKPHIKTLITYNTVLLALDNPKSILGRIQRIKGGNVDRGEPVRDSAKVLFDLLDDVEMFKMVRSKSEDPDSLVPVGNKEEVGFVSDEVRKAMLEDKLQKHRDIRIQSNLKTPNDAIFGAGYVSKDGKTVVGAAHGLDEMLKMAAKNSKKYSDNDEYSEQQLREQEYLEKLKHEVQMSKVKSVRSVDSGSISGSGHDSGTAEPIIDLLDFDAPSEPEPEIVKSPSLPYAVTNEETYILPEEDGIDEKNNITTTPTTEGGIFSLTNHMDMNNISHTTEIAEDRNCLLDLTSSAYPTGMQDSLSASMGNMALNNDGNNHESSTAFSNVPSSLIDPISSALPMTQSNNYNNMLSTISSQNSIMGGSIRNSNSANAISSFDMIAPVMGGNTMPTSLNTPMKNYEKPQTPSNSPPTIPPMPSGSPPSEPRSSPIPMGGMAQVPVPVPVQTPELPRSSPVPMGGMPSSQSSFASNINMSSMPTPNLNGQKMMNDTSSLPNNNINPLAQQQEMMMMMMNQQKMMQQNMNNGGGHDQQAQMMQQMMMMNQQMMQLMSMQNQPQLMQQQAMNPLQQQQQQMMMMMGQQQGSDNDNSNGMSSQQNMNNGSNYPTSMNPFP